MVLIALPALLAHIHENGMFLLKVWGSPPPHYYTHTHTHTKNPSSVSMKGRDVYISISNTSASIERPSVVCAHSRDWACCFLESTIWNIPSCINGLQTLLLLSLFSFVILSVVVSGYCGEKASRVLKISGAVGGEMTSGDETVSFTSQQQSMSVGNFVVFFNEIQINNIGKVTGYQ